MGKSLKRKMKLLVPEDQGAAVLRAVADGLETGTMDIEGGQVPLEGFVSLGVSLKRSAEGLGVKLKIKFPAPEEPEAVEGNADDDDTDDDDDDDDEDADEDDDGHAADKPPPASAKTSLKKLPKYSSLKKWMKKEFKTIQAALVEGRLPDADLAASFVEDSRCMVLYPGKGDEYYPAYSAATDAFEQAMAAGSLEAAAAAVADLEALKSACHDKYE